MPARSPLLNPKPCSLSLRGHGGEVTYPKTSENAIPSPPSSLPSVRLYPLHRRDLPMPPWPPLPRFPGSPVPRPRWNTTVPFPIHGRRYFPRARPRRSCLLRARRRYQGSGHRDHWFPWCRKGRLFI